MGMDKGAYAVSAKPTGLAAFTRNKEPESVVARARKKARGDTVALTVRLPRAEWERLHQLALAEGVSIQGLAEEGFSRVYQDRGLPPIPA